MLSIIITALNEDHFELNQTIASIRATAGGVEIIVVDDLSSTPVVCEDTAVKVIHNRFRCGVGPSRHIGACAATGEWLLIIDSHMRFKPGWFDYALARMKAEYDQVLYCATCLGLDRFHMDINAPTARYYGATMNFYGPDRHKAGAMQVFEAVWNDPPPEDNAEICAVMGACYFINREWFFHISPLRHLKFWGQDEQMLSIKTWLAGGSVRIMKNVEIGHVFWTDAKPVIKKQFTVAAGYTAWNKLFAIHTLCLPDVAERLGARLFEILPSVESVCAAAMLKEDWRTIATEQADNKRIFIRDIRWLADKFALTLP